MFNRHQLAAAFAFVACVAMLAGVPVAILIIGSNR